MGVRSALGQGIAALCVGLAFILGGCPWLPSDNTNANANANANTNVNTNDNTGGNTNTNTNSNANTNDNADPINNTDKTNAGALAVGANACRNCHSDIADLHSRHGHAYKLNAVNGQPPTFPAGTSAGVPNTPDGFTWADVAYVIGGYTKKGRFIDQDGYILTTGVTGKKTQWNLAFAPNGTQPSWGNYEPDHSELKPYDYSCFVCHTTGATPQNEDFPEFQENRPGMAGTWAEPGIQCEACHGPGSNHFAIVDGEVAIKTDRIFIDPTGAKSCYECHNRPFNDQSGKIIAKGGYIQHHEQWPELKASGGHAGFACIECHDPHRSVMYDRANAIRKQCTDCHADRSMAGHTGKVYTRTDGYTETLSCESCHMPYVTKSATNASADLVGSVARIGDTRTHIFRISTEPKDYTGFYSADGSEVVRDDQGRAAVTVDFVCIRCHNGHGAFELSVEMASEIAQNLHDFP